MIRACGVFLRELLKAFGVLAALWLFLLLLYALDPRG